MTATTTTNTGAMTGAMAIAEKTAMAMNMDTALKVMPTVEEREVFYADDNSRKRIPIPGQKVLVDPANDRVFNIVTGDYQLIDHKSVIDMVESVVQEMPEYGDPERTVWLPQDGAKMRVRYVFNDTARKLKGDGEEGIAPRFDIFNSYDGTWALRGIFGAYRLVCLNGMTVSDSRFKEIVFRREHHQPMNGTEDLKRTIIAGMNAMNDQFKLWGSWLDRMTTSRDYENVVDGLQLNKTQEEELHREVEISSGHRLEEQKITSLTYWMFYAIVTQYITHRVDSQIKQQRMMGRVQRLFR